MREMVVGEKDLLPADTQLGLQGARDPEFVEHPADHGLAKHLPRLRVSLQHTHQEAIEFAERPLVEDHVVEVIRINLGLAETKTDGVCWKAEVVFDSRKALFFCRGDKLAVAQKRGRGIVVIAGDSENMHQL